MCYWRDRVSDPLGRLKALAADEHPRVRLEAVRAASFFTEPEAVEAFVAEHPVPQAKQTVKQHLERMKVSVVLRQREADRLRRP